MRGLLILFAAYDELSHLTDYEFSQRLQLMRKIHGDLVKTGDVKSAKKRPKFRSKKKKSAKKKSHSAHREPSSPSACEFASAREFIRQAGPTDNCSNKRPTSSTSQRSTGGSSSQRFRSLREIVQADLDELNKQFDEKWDKFCCSRRAAVLSPEKCAPREIPTIEVHHVDERHSVSPMNTNCHHHHHLHPHNQHHYHHLCPLCSLEFNNLEIEPCDSRSATRSSNETERKSSNDFPEVTSFKRSKSCPSDLNASIEADEPPCRSDSTCRYTEPEERRMRRCQSAKKSDEKSAKPRRDDPLVNFIAVRMVRSNLAANLRHQWSRQKLQELADRKIKSPGRTISFIPECHRWSVDKTPGWKMFTDEE